MPYWSCTVYQINPECKLNAVSDILTAEGEEYYVGSHEGESRYLYIDKVTPNSHGENIEGALDILSPSFPYRKKTTRRFVTTTSLNIQLLNRENIDNLILVYASSSNASEVRSALKPIYSVLHQQDKRVLLPVAFKLRETYDYLVQKFPGMEEFAVDQIRDSRLKKMRAGGIDLEDSEEFNVYVLDNNRSGRLSCMGLNVANCTIKLKTNGSMYSSDGTRPVPQVVSILNTLHECRGLITVPDIRSFIR